MQRPAVKKLDSSTEKRYILWWTLRTSFMFFKGMYQQNIGGFLNCILKNIFSAVHVFWNLVLCDKLALHSSCNQIKVCGKSHLYMLSGTMSLKPVSQKALSESALCVFCVLQQNICSTSSTAMCKEQIEFNYLQLVSSKAQLEVLFSGFVSKKGSNHIS